MVFYDTKNAFAKETYFCASALAKSSKILSNSEFLLISDLSASVGLMISNKLNYF